jgi:hypothetical protein
MLARTYQVQGRVDEEVVALARKAVELDPSSGAAEELLRQLEAAGRGAGPR